MFDRTDYGVVRKDVLDTLDNFVKEGWQPGGFCMAVLENNLMEAFGRADLENRATLYWICRYVYNELPEACHGSPEAVQRWMKKIRAAGVGSQ